MLLPGLAARTEQGFIMLVVLKGLNVVGIGQEQNNNS